MNNTKSGFPRLSGDYNKGYTKAIQDIINVFDYVNWDLTSCRQRMNYKWAKMILECCLENREKLREYWDGFIRVGNSESGHRDIIEWYSQKDKGGRTK